MMNPPNENSSLNQQNQTDPSSYPNNSGQREFKYKEYYRWMNEQLTERIQTLAVALLGNPTCKRPTEWRWGKKGEVVVYISGSKIGRFADFESGVSGDALELVRYKTGYRSTELSDWVKNFIGYRPRTFVKKEEEVWMPIVPVPEEALGGDILKGLTESFTRKGYAEIGRYCYRDLNGHVLGYVVRFEKDGEKMTLPLTYCENSKGAKSWWWKGFPIPRFPYGTELLTPSVNKVLVVEGEKKCEAARALFPDFAVISWVSGTGSVHLTDWSCLKDKQVILWPDNDEPGLNCMAKLKIILEKVGVQKVHIVSLPSDTPQGWDLADDIPQSWDMDRIYSFLREERMPLS